MPADFSGRCYEDGNVITLIRSLFRAVPGHQNWYLSRTRALLKSKFPAQALQSVCGFGAEGGVFDFWVEDSR